MGILKRIFKKEEPTPTPTKIVIDARFNQEILKYISPDNPNVVVTHTTPSPGGGGGGGGGGGSTTLGYQQQGGVQTGTQTGTGSVIGETKVEIVPSGGVRIGKHRYMGTSFIRDLGMTAQEYEKSVKVKLIEQGTPEKQLKTGGWGATIIYSPYETIVGKTQPGIQTSALVSGGQEYAPDGSILYSGQASSVSDWTGTGIRGGISTGLGKLGFAGRVVDVLVPKTITGGVLMVGAGLGYGFLPSIVKTGVSGYFAYSGTKGALSTDLPTEQRVASGIVGGLGFTGLGAETLPYFRGVKAKLSTDYMPVGKQPKGFEAIEIAKPIRLPPEEYALKLVKEGKLIYKPSEVLPKGVMGRYLSGGGEKIVEVSSKLKLGTFKRSEILAHELIHYKTYKNIPQELIKIEQLLPYDVRPGEMIAYGLQKRYAIKGFGTTEELKIGLIPEKAPARIGLTSEVELPKISPLKRGGFDVKPSEKGLFLGEQTVTTSQIGFFKTGKTIQLEREFFTTPAEPFLKIPETRISRLGLGSLFKIPESSQIKFGLPGKPQIGFETGAVVTRAGLGRAYKIGRGTELEAIKEFGTITDVQKIGVTSIRGQGVELYEFKTGKGGASPSGVKKALSTEGITRVSGEGVLSSALSIRRISTALTPMTKGFSLSKPTITKSYFDFKRFSPIIYGKRGISTGISFISPRQVPYEGISGGQPYTGISYKPFSTGRKDIFGALPQLKFPKGGGIIRGERLFISTPSFGTALGKEFGIEFKTSKLGGLSGLGERGYATGIKLPTTILKTVQAKEFSTFPKIKSYMKSVI